MAKGYEKIFAPFDMTASLFTKNAERLVPFKIGTIMQQLSSGQLPDINSTIPGLSTILSAIPGAGGLIGDVEEIFKKLVSFNVPGLLGELVHLIPDVANFVGQQLWVGLSVLAVATHAAQDQLDINEGIRIAYRAYFFGESGYITLEGGRIAPPTIEARASDQAITWADLSSELHRHTTRKTADQYVRDLVRLTVEAAGNSIYQLDGHAGRYARLRALSDPHARTKQVWFRGYAALAESSVMSAVEQAAMGISGLSTNPLIAASLATFAATAARKATQHVFLHEIGIPLR